MFMHDFKYKKIIDALRHTEAYHKLVCNVAYDIYVVSESVWPHTRGYQPYPYREFDTYGGPFGDLLNTRECNRHARKDAARLIMNRLSQYDEPHLLDSESFKIKEGDFPTEFEKILMKRQAK